MTPTQPRPPVLPPPFDTPETLRPPDTDPAGNTRYGDVEFGFTMGYRPLRMDVTVPTAARGPVPVVVFIHGGAFMMGSRLKGPVSQPVWHALLDRGLAIASIEYRLSGEALFPACLHDVKAAVRWLRRFGPALGTRADAIGVLGESAGGHLSAFLGLNNPDEHLNGRVGVTGVSSDVQVAVAWYPPTDFLRMDEQAGLDAHELHDVAGSPESKLIGGPLQDDAKAAAYASPISHVTPAAGPMLLVHGMRDRNVPYQQSVALKEELDRVGAPARLELVPDAGHVWLGIDNAPIIAMSTDFLAQHLQ